jgi:hypothetical protein
MEIELPQISTPSSTGVMSERESRCAVMMERKAAAEAREEPPTATREVDVMPAVAEEQAVQPVEVAKIVEVQPEEVAKPVPSGSARKRKSGGGREEREGSALSSARTPVEDDYTIPKELVSYPVDKRFWEVVGRTFRPDKEVGKGTFGCVYKAAYVGNGGRGPKFVAVKRLFAYQKTDAHKSEASFMRPLRGKENIAQLLDLEGAKGGVILVEEQQVPCSTHSHDRNTTIHLVTTETHNVSQSHARKT